MVAGRAENADEQLLIEHCGSCGRWVHPPAGNCPDCGGQLAAEPVSGHGTVFTYTVNVQPFNPAIPTPYVIAIVELDEQHDLRLAANIVDCEPDSVFCGMPVQLQARTGGTSRLRGNTKAPHSAPEKGLLLGAPPSGGLLAVPT